MPLSDDDFDWAYRKVCDTLAGKCVFGHWTREDITQEIWLLCRGARDRYDPSRAKGATDRERAANFFFMHCRKKLANKKRDKYHRPDPPCPRCGSGEFCETGGCQPFRRWRQQNAAKAALFQCAGGDNPRKRDWERDPAGFREDTPQAEPADSELIRLVEERIQPEHRTDWLRLKAGARFPKGRRSKILERVAAILAELGVVPDASRPVGEDRESLRDSTNPQHTLPAGQTAHEDYENHGQG